MMGRALQQGFTRREFVTSAGAGIAGLAVGGVAGYALAPSDGGASGAEEGSKEPIHIGGAYPLTGAVAGDGVDARRGAELAVKEINESGGVLGRELVLDTEDLEDLAADKVVNAFQRLINEKNVKALFMAYADVAMAEFPIIAESRIPFFHADTLVDAANWVAEDFEKRNNIYQFCPHELPYGEGLLNFLKSIEEAGLWKPAKKTVAIVATNNPYALNIASAFEKAAGPEGWKTILKEKVNPPLTEWGPVLAKIRENPPDLIMNLDYYMADLASFTKQFVAAPTQSLLYEQYGPAVPQYLDLAGDAANGVFWSTVIGVVPDAIGEDWKARFEAMHNEAPGLANAGGQYDAIMVWRRAASLAGNPEDLEAVNAMLRPVISRGVCGGQSFDPENMTTLSYPGKGKGMVMDPTLGMPNLMFQIQDLQQVLVGPDPFSVGTFELPPWYK